MTNREQKVSIRLKKSVYSDISTPEGECLNHCFYGGNRWYALGESNPSFQVENLNQTARNHAENCGKQIDTAPPTLPLKLHTFSERVSIFPRRFRVSAPSPKSPQMLWFAS